MEEVPTIMEGFTTALGAFWDIIDSSWTNVTSNAVWSVPLAVPLAGTGVSFMKRLVKVGSGRRGR